MMFIFYSSQQTNANASYYKGQLFEKLIKKLFEELGYNNIELRQKNNSLEYDVTGTHIATGKSLISEAKAHENTIAGKDVSSFAGKLIPLGLLQHKVDGIFLSTSSFSPEAEEYYRSLKEFSVKRITGHDLYELFSEKLQIIKTANLKNKITADYTLVTDYLLVTDTGNFKVVICRSKGNASPNCFFIFTKDGEAIIEKNFLSKLKENISILQDLEPVIRTSSPLSNTGRYIETGIKLSDDWIDYKLPAGPKFFVGRTSTLQNIEEAIFEKRASIIQIKSRSGVGKSSLLAYLENTLNNKGYKTELHDSRDIKSILDIYLLVQRFTGASQVARDFSEIRSQIEIYLQSHTKKSFFMVDQFESTFTRKEIFDSYESLFNIFQTFSEKIIVILARKNDQLTTFDETTISLDKINNSSTSITLKDFEKEEAVELIKSITSVKEDILDKDVLSYILEFSQGFPWLIKRTMAHVLNQLQNGTSRKDLIATGLMLSDLFNEELSGLDEIEQDYLNRIVQYLPANYNQLQKSFDEDPFLTKILDSLTRQRIIRLSGSTYDTYNDVLKEYILYKKLPQFKQKSIYRINAPAVIKNYHQILPLVEFDMPKAISSLGIVEGSIFNFIREWKTLGLLESTQSGWKIPQIIIDVMKEGRLGDHLRRELAKNEVISKILHLLTQKNSIAIEDIERILTLEFPFLELSSATWTAYAKCFVTWLNTVQLIEIERTSGNIKLPSKTRDEIIKDLGNLTAIKSGRRNSREAFTPNARYVISLSILNKYLSSPQCGIDINKLTREEKKGYSDLKLGGWIDENKFTIASIDEFKEESSETLIENYSNFWEASKNDQDLLLTIKQVFPSHSDSSLKNIIKILLSWGKGLAIIPNKRYKYSQEKRQRSAKKKIVKKKVKVTKKTHKASVRRKKKL